MLVVVVALFAVVSWRKGSPRVLSDSFMTNPKFLSHILHYDAKR